MDSYIYLQWIILGQRIQISKFQDFDAINRPVVAMSVDNEDNIESIDNALDSGDDIVDNTLLKC